MAEISAALVKELRDETNVSMMECKRALVDAGGDKAKAFTLLRERGIAVAAKKAVRATNQGLIAAWVAPDGAAGALVEVKCETDFVARNAGFVAFAGEVARRAGRSEGGVAELVKADLTAKVAELGENLVIGRSVRYARQGPGRVAAYVHLGGKTAVLLEVSCGKPATADAPAFQDLAKDLTMHIAACSPRYLVSADVPAEVIAAERDIYAKQVTNKPPAVVQKIVDGKVRKFFSEVCLVDQPFVKEVKLSVTQLLEARGKELGDALRVVRFVRLQLGE